MPLVNAGQRVTGGLLSEDYASSDTTSRTVTAATITQLSNYFAIPANDAQAGVAYRVTAWGSGTQGSTQQNANFILSLSGANTSQAGMISTALNASQGFSWRWTGIIVIQTIGSTGTFSFSNEAQISASVAASQSIGVLRSFANIAINTTIANTLGLGFLWTATTGAPTITCLGSTFERLGG